MRNIICWTGSILLTPVLVGLVILILHYVGVAVVVYSGLPPLLPPPDSPPYAVMGALVLALLLLAIMIFGVIADALHELCQEAWRRILK